MAWTVEERLNHSLQMADRIPFDTIDQWYEVAANLDMEQDTNAPPPVDWAHRAARGIIEELRDDRGSALEDAFHRERVSEEGRYELVHAIAGIIRLAFEQSKE